jgi:hypothetical protein
MNHESGVMWKEADMVCLKPTCKNKLEGCVLVVAALEFPDRVLER